jgi:hypothetical protein
MNATAANLIERVLPPESGPRQWVLTFPFSWRRRLAQDGALLGRLTRIAVVKKAYTDGTIAVDMDPLSLLCRLATSVRPPRFQGRRKLLALVKGPARIARYLATEGEATEVPQRSPGRGPPYWKGGGGRGGADDVA